MSARNSRWFSLGSVGASVLALVLMVLASRWFVERWEAVVATGRMTPIRWGWVLLATALFCAHAASALIIWRRVLLVTRGALPWRVALDVFTPTLLARYVPGRIWANAARLALAKRAGVPYLQTTGALVWEVGIALGTAAIVAALTLRTTVDDRQWLAITSVAVGALLVAVIIGALGRLPNGLPGTAASAVVGWALFGAAHLAVARSVSDVGLAQLPVISGAMALAWSAGFLAIVVPLGFGVRDALSLLVLSAVLDPAAGLQFVALARLAQLVADFALTLAWLAARRWLSGLPSA